MADEETTTEEAPAKKKLPVKLIAIIGIVMAVEGVFFGGIYLLFGESPPAVQASDPLQDDPTAALFDMVEVELIGGKFQNNRQGAQSYLYETTIHVLVQRRYEEIVRGQIKQYGARIREDVTQVFASAEPAELNEPDRATIKRKVMDRCQKRFGKDPDGEEYVHGVVIIWSRFNADL